LPEFSEEITNFLSEKKRSLFSFLFGLKREDYFYCDPFRRAFKQYTQRGEVVIVNILLLP